MHNTRNYIKMNKFEQIFNTIIIAMSDEINQFVLMQRICNILIYSIFSTIGNKQVQ